MQDLFSLISIKPDSSVNKDNPLDINSLCSKLHHKIRARCPVSIYASSSTPVSTHSSFRWLFFRNYQWIPFDSRNHSRIDSTLLTDGKYVDIEDSNFDEIKRVRVFPILGYV